ncbi:MAG: hypothetical protein HY820_27345 [Acidobacteria bacterium]|nr:hypothetical protein [Acidobacteriota bacterium]
MPPDFAFPNRRVDVFTWMWAEYSGRDFYVVARLRPGVGFASVQAEMTSIATVTATENPVMNAGYGATVMPRTNTLSDGSVLFCESCLRLSRSFF